ncbi:hypothetical protein [Sphingobacterium hungaricum]
MKNDRIQVTYRLVMEWFEVGISSAYVLLHEFKNKARVRQDKKLYIQDLARALGISTLELMKIIKYKNRLTRLNSLMVKQKIVNPKKIRRKFIYKEI